MQKLIHKYCICLFLAGLPFLEGIPQNTLPISPSRIIHAPSDTSMWKTWKDNLHKMREDIRVKIHYSDLLYTDHNYKWTSGCFNVCMLMLFDKRFYDAERGKYNVDSFIQDGIEQFGGYDGVVLWHAYPRIGFDERNQFDFYRGFPGGLAGLREIVDRFHKKGIKVFIDYNPWDTGTRRENRQDIDLICEIILAIDADGIFLDTMKGSSDDFVGKLNQVKKGIALESELELPVEQIKDHHMSWAQHYKDSDVPGVMWNKWFERRHILHMTSRWEKDHSPELQTAWMNGCGMIIWDNIFGTCNLYNERDKSILLSMVPIQRRYHALFSGEGWEPLSQRSLPDIFVNRWFNDSIILWTLVNRSNTDQHGMLLRTRHYPGKKYFNLITGRETGLIRGDTVFIHDSLRSRGIGAVITVKEEDVNAGFKNFLQQQQILYSKYKSDTSFTYPDERIHVTPSVGYPKSSLPKGMILIKGTSHTATVRYTQRECGFYKDPGQAYPVMPNYRMFEEIIRKTDVVLTDFAIDETPVTNQQFYEFIKDTRYRPANNECFLAHWINMHPGKGKEDHPVVYVNIDDARAYARWAGKRLPTEAEWQYAAEGPEHTSYPWGNVFNENYCNNGQFSGTTPVKQFTDGRSSFGCYDMCGNTWEWTGSERSDQLTRFCIIKGGSYFKAEGSHWYTDGHAQRNDFSAKFILMNPGLDRCATIGFRCAADIKD